MALVSFPIPEKCYHHHHLVLYQQELTIIFLHSFIISVGVLISYNLIKLSIIISDSHTWFFFPLFFLLLQHFHCHFVYCMSYKSTLFLLYFFFFVTRYFCLSQSSHILLISNLYVQGICNILLINHISLTRPAYCP